MTLCNQCIRSSRSITNVLCVLQVREVPGITIFRSSATMYFANAELYLEALEKKVNNFLFELGNNKVYIFSMLECLITVVFSQGPGPTKGHSIQKVT